MIKENRYEKAVFSLLAAVLVSLAFGIRIVNSVSIMMLVVITVVHPQRAIYFKRAFSNPYFICCVLLFIIRAIGILYADNIEENEKQIFSKSIFLAVPFFFCANESISGKVMYRLIMIFSISLSIVSIACILYALFNYFQQQDFSVFFYHKLVNPFKHHAVLFSFYLLFCIVYWVEEGFDLIKKRSIKLLLAATVVYFFFLIVLLSSKLVILISCAYIVYILIDNLVKLKRRYILYILSLFLFLIISILFLTNNPVKSRFSDAISGSKDLFKQEKFSGSTYFNGVQFRLLIWRFTYEILEEKNAWLIGVSPGDAQSELNRKYIETNIYLGDGIRDNKGYRAFNSHNVFLQTALESGLIGLAILLSMIFVFAYQAIKKQRRSTIIFYIFILALCFTESVLATQYSILLFMFFPLLTLNVRETS